MADMGTASLTASLRVAVSQLLLDPVKEFDDLISCHRDGVEILNKFTSEPGIPIVFLDFNGEELETDFRIFEEDLGAVVLDPLL